MARPCGAPTKISVFQVLRGLPGVVAAGLRWSISLGFVLEIACCSAGTNPVPAVCTDVVQEDACVDFEGVWVGGSSAPYCACPSADSGKVCVGHSSCQGLCVSETATTSASCMLSTQGTCSAFRKLPACACMVDREAGESRLLCVDFTRSK